MELIITADTDLIQTEAYPLVENFGCVLLRKKDPDYIDIVEHDEDDLDDD